MENSNNLAIDEAGFEAFFKTHPNDATVAEDLPATDDADTTANTNTDGGDGSTPNGTDGTDTTGAADTSAATGDGAQTSQTDDVNKTSNTKQAQAFAQMRIANQQQAQLIKQIAGVVGIADTKDPEAIMNALQQVVVKAQSQKQGIPEEVLTRLNHLENMNSEYQKQQAYIAAGRGFQTIKDKYGLDNNGLEAFAQELIADGLNPYESPIDLVTEYKVRHFDELIEQAVQRGIEQEAQRAAKAGTQSSTPSNTNGGRTDSDAPKITTVAELNKFLDENK